VPVSKSFILHHHGRRLRRWRLLAQGVEAIVIHFLHSYQNPQHERRAAAAVRELWPNPYVTAGSDSLPEFRELERGTSSRTASSRSAARWI
jgi:N-methylhydantoinase A